MVSFTFQTLNQILSSVEKFSAICFMVISLVKQTLTCGLITTGRLKFMDDFSNNVTNINYNLISMALKL